MDIIRPATGGEARVAPGCNPGDIPLDWTDDDSALFVSERGQCVLKIFRVDVATGERREWVTIRPDDPAGILDIMPVHISPDGHTYAYRYRAAVAEPAPNHNFAKNLSLVERIEEIAKAKGCTPGQLGLAWVLAQGEDIVPIPGTK